MTNRMASRTFVVRAGLGLLVLAALGLYLGTRFRIGIDGQVHQCLPPYSVWLIDRHDRVLVRGATYSFFAGDAMARSSPPASPWSNPCAGSLGIG
jgi:conjugal transfer pilin signal peptidase TrbI